MAIVTLEIAISPSGLSFLKGVYHIFSRLLVVSIWGIIGGMLLTLLFRIRALIPEGLENVFILSWVFALFQISNTISAESGIVAVVIAGMTIGNTKTYIHRELLEFEEQLTVLMIGMLFVILAADVKLTEVQALGMRGLITVLLLMFIIRPISVFAATAQSHLSRNQKLLISWIAPRGIVAAAIASLFVIELNNHGFGGEQLRALVFLVITLTVLSAGLTGGFAASILELKRNQDSGWIILGAHEVARLLARYLKLYGEEVICIDENPQACRLAENEGIKVFYGNAREERTLQRTEPDTRKGIIALSGNEEVNFIFSQRAKHLEKEIVILTGIKNPSEGITQEMVLDSGARVPFGRIADMEQWSSWIQRENTIHKTYVFRGKNVVDPADHTMIRIMLPLVYIRKASVSPVDNQYQLKKEDQVIFLINENRLDEANDWLNKNGFTPV